MSHANIEVVRKLYEVQGDPQQFLELLDPHVVWINFASAPETRPFIGHEGVREWVEGFREEFGSFRMEATEVIDAGGDQVVAVNRVLGTGTRSGIPIDREFGSLLTLVNGKIARVQGFETRAKALEAAGLRE